MIQRLRVLVDVVNWSFVAQNGRRRAEKRAAVLLTLRRLGSLVILTMALMLISGCSSPSSGKQTFKLTGDPVVDSQNGREHGRPQDRLLWTYRGGLAALRRNDFTTAKPLFDEAVERLNGMYGKDRSAKKSRSYFNRESRKTFYGEPYERVMAFYYRGILYWMDGEYDNARACFRSAQLMDSSVGEDKQDSDFVLLDYLDSWASIQMGADGSDALKRAKAHLKIAVPPEPDPKANVFVFFEFGSGPRKVAGGESGERLQFIPGTSPVATARIRVANYDVTVAPYDDLNFQATTRAGRVMDQILARKKDFKQGTDAVGDAAIVSGAILGATSRHNDEAALGLVAAGLLSKIISAATTPEADTRTWDNLPLYLTFTSMKLAPGPYSAVVEFLDTAGKPVTTFTKQITFTVPAGPLTKTLFISDQSITPQTL